jgi:hypothetical protein
MVEERGYKKTLKEILNRLTSGKILDDAIGRSTLNTIFGEQINIIPHADIEEQFHYNINTRTLTTTNANGGTATVENDMMKLSSSTATNGSTKVETNRPIRYRPGKEAFALFTAQWDNGGVAGCKQRIGIFNGTDGYYVGFNGTDFVAGYSTSGSDTEVTQANMSGDSTYIDQLDFTKLNIFRISYGWLGTAPVTFEFLGSDHHWHELHIIEFQNTLTRPSVDNPSLPICAHVTKTSGATDVVMRSASWLGGVHGEDHSPGDRYDTGTVSATGVSTEAVLIHFQNVTTFQSKTNRVEVEGVRVSIASDGTKTGKVKIYKNLSITSPSWSNIDATNSVLQTSTAGTVTPSDANLLFEYNLGRTDSIVDDISDMDMILEPGDTVTITGQSAANMDFDFTARWREHF